MPEHIREQLETAIDARLQTGAQRFDFGIYLFPTSLLRGWHETNKIESAYNGFALTAKVCMEVTHERELEKKLPLLNRTISNRPEFMSIKLGVLPYGSIIDQSYRFAHQLTLNANQEPLLVNVVQDGKSRHQNHSVASGIDLGYFLQFVQNSEALVPEAILVIH